MWKTIKTLLAGFILPIVLFVGIAAAQTTKTPLPNTGWTSLGAGPLFLSTTGQAFYAVSGTTPSLAVEGLPVPDGGVGVNTTETVWARPQESAQGVVAYTYATVAGTFSGTFTWPGTAGLGTGGTAAAGGATMPYINAYIIGGGSGGGPITAPLGTQTIANSVAVTPATSSTWPVTGTFWQATQPVSGTFWQATQPVSAVSLPLPSGAATSALQTTGNTALSTINTTLGSPFQAGGSIGNTAFGISGTLPAFTSTPTFNCGTGCGSPPLGTQPIANSGAVNPATSSVWPTALTPDSTLATGNISIVDSGTTTQSATGGQVYITGTPTPNSFVQTAVNSASLAVNVTVSGGTFTSMQLVTEVSHDNVNWYPRGMFLDGNPIPNWKTCFGAPCEGEISTQNWQYFRVRAAIFTVATGTPVLAITITQSQHTAVQYIGNLPMTAPGSSALGAVAMQGVGGGLPVITNQTQLAGTTLGAPTAAGVSASGNVPAIQGVTGGVPVPITGSVTASFSQFAPNGNYSTPLTVGATSARTALPSGGGSTVAVYNTGANAAFVQLGNASVVATASDDQVAPGGFLCFAVGSNVDIAAIETAGATTLNVSGGSGGCAGSGGGGGGGSGGNVTITSPLGTQSIAASVAVTPATSSTWPVSAASLPLPSGAATSALQTTGNTSLSSILTALGSPFQAGGSLAANQSVNLTQMGGSAISSGAVSAIGTAGTGNVPNVNAYIVGGAGSASNITQWATTSLGVPTAYGTAPTSGNYIGVNAYVTNTNANGQTTMSASSPVTLASDQSAVATKAASGAFVAGSIADLAHGQATMAASVPVTLASNQSTVPVSNASLPLPTGAATSALQTTINTTLGSPMQQTGGSVSVTPYPATAVPITASATGTTGATTATLTNVTGHTTYICGFSIRANATAAATGNATVTGTISGTLNFTQWTAPNASGVGVTEIPFSPCVPASAISTSIAVVSAAPGTGGVVSVTAWGYSL
jgi:hypothetical protein